MIKVILALPMFTDSTIQSQPLVRYIFEPIVMAVIVIIGVIVSVFTILYFSPLDAAIAYWDKMQQRHRYINSMYYIILTNLILFNCGIPSRVFLPLT